MLAELAAGWRRPTSRQAAIDAALAEFCRGARPQARPGRPAAAGCTDRQHHQPWHRRHGRGPGAPRNPGPAAPGRRSRPHRRLMARSIKEAEARILLLEQLVSSLRHDIRGAITPALLVSDGLRSNPDPRVQRAIDKIAQSVLRVTAMLDATRDLVPSMRNKAADKPG